MGNKILFAFVLAAFAASAQNNAPGNQNNTATNNNQYSAGSTEDLSRLAGHMLDCTNKARTAIRNGNHQQAAQDVDQAQSYYQKLQDFAPGAAMVPVYQEFVSISVLGPVSAEQNARRASEEGQNAGNTQAVQQVAGDYTHVTVSMPVARISLEDAQAAIRKGDWKMADAALADVQEGVKIESVEGDMPLSRVRENLILARAAARHDHYAEAKASLDAASQALSVYAEHGGQHADQARALEQQINTFANNIQQESASAVAKIGSWWKVTGSWSAYRSAQS